jgi:hypothetical protein
MGTFLVTPKMAPALADRIRRSLEGPRRGAGGGIFAARIGVSLFRLGILLALAAATGLIVVARQRARQGLERERTALLDALRGQDAAVVRDQKAFTERIEPWLRRFSDAYEGDLVAAELRVPKAMAAVLARPSVYVRGRLGAFATASATTDAAASSGKDPLLLCLIDPPASRAEKSVLGKIRSAYGTSALFEERTAHVRRLHEAIAELPALLPSFVERVDAAREPRELARLEEQLAQTPVARTKRALGSEMLVLAMDEPDEGGPADLDGERAHFVRVGVVDLVSAKPLLRIRKRVDPNWISPAVRPMYAKMLDSCALALDVQAAAGN